MTTPSDGWDRDEEDLPADLARELAALRSRRATDPPIDVLRAAGAGVLPDDLEEAAQRHLARNTWSRAMVDGLNHAEASLSVEDQARLLARIQREAGKADRPRTIWAWQWQSAAAALVMAVAGGFWITWSRPDTGPSTPPAPTGPVAVTPPAPTPAPTFLLPLEKPDVRISLASMTWRGAPPDNPLLADLKPALDAFRAADHATADRLFTALSKRYPSAIEIALYQGVSRLFLNDLDGAVTKLREADRMADPSFANDIAWYLAVADERAGKLDEARARLETLCPASRPGDRRACAALGR